MVEYQNVRGTIMSSRSSTSSIARGKKSTRGADVVPVISSRSH